MVTCPATMTLACAVRGGGGEGSEGCACPHSCDLQVGGFDGAAASKLRQRATHECAPLSRVVGNCWCVCCHGVDAHLCVLSVFGCSMFTPALNCSDFLYQASFCSLHCAGACDDDNGVCCA